MSRLKIATANVAGQTVESLYKDLERMIVAIPEYVRSTLRSTSSDCAMHRHVVNVFPAV